MLHWAAPLLADCYSPRWPRCFSFRRSTAFCMGCVIAPRRTVFSLKHRIAKRNFEVMPMQSQTAGQISVQGAHAPGNAAPQRRSLRGWLIGGAVFLIFAGVLIYGILDRMHASAALRGETA